MGETTVPLCDSEYADQLPPQLPDPVLVDRVPKLEVVPEMQLVLLPPDGRVPARQRIERGPSFGGTDGRGEPGFEAIVEVCGAGEGGRGRDPVLGGGEAEVFGSEAVGRRAWLWALAGCEGKAILLDLGECGLDDGVAGDAG